jgi:copper homeostasis protein (lipoprotein)
MALCASFLVPPLRSRNSRRNSSPRLAGAADSDRVSGSGGCNRLMGGFRLAGEALSFSRLAGTTMACGPEAMALERRYSEALQRVRRWSIDRRSLLLQDAGGRTLLLFQAEDQ